MNSSTQRDRQGCFKPYRERHVDSRANINSNHQENCDGFRWLATAAVLGCVLSLAGCNAKVTLENQASNEQHQAEFWPREVVQDIIKSAFEDKITVSSETKSHDTTIGESVAAEIEAESFESDSEIHAADTPEATEGNASNTPESVAPEVIAGKEKLLPEKRPDWVAQKDSVDGELHTLIITTPPGNSIEECANKIPAVALERFQRYAKDQLQVDLSEVSKVDATWVADRVLNSQDRFFVERDVDGTMTYSGWARMQVDPLTRTEVAEIHRQSQWKTRSMHVGSMLLCAVALFGATHMGLQLVRSTKR